MTYRLGLAQCDYPTDGDVLAQVESFADAAEQAGVHLLVFPECLMSPHEMTANELRVLAEPLGGPYLQGIANCAQRHHLWIVVTMSEINPTGGPPFNTAVVVDDAGLVQGIYRKCHLYDAHSVRESDRMSAGDCLCAPITTPFGSIGIGICYDLRFPEVARAAACAGCGLIVFPAAWYNGPHKFEHWKTLLRARAIENECFVAGICHAGLRFVGRSMVVNPLGEVLATGPAPANGPDGEALIVADIDEREIDAARDAMPILQHRRPEIYPRT